MRPKVTDPESTPKEGKIEGFRYINVTFSEKHLSGVCTCKNHGLTLGLIHEIHETIFLGKSLVKLF